MKNPSHSSATFSYRTFGTKGHPVIFFFTAFRSKYWLYYPTIKKLVSSGYYVIVYDVNAKAIFTGDVEGFLSLMSKIVATVKSQRAEFKEFGAKKFFSFGVSMGTLLALRVGVEIPEIKKIVVNLTYGRLADNIWSWKVLGGIKNRLLTSGITKAKLENLLEPISPVSMAPKLKGKKLLLYLSKKDKIILYSQSSEFKEALDKAKVDYVYIQSNKFGHFISGALNNLRSKIYLSFLEKD